MKLEGERRRKWNTFHSLVAVWWWHSFHRQHTFATCKNVFCFESNSATFSVWPTAKFMFFFNYKTKIFLLIFELFKKIISIFPPLWFSSLSVCRYEWSIRDYTRALIFPHSERNNKSKCDGMRRWRRWSIESTVCLLSINHAGSPGVVAFVCDMMRIFQSGKKCIFDSRKSWVNSRFKCPSLVTLKLHSSLHCANLKVHFYSSFHITFFVNIKRSPNGRIMWCDASIGVRRGVERLINNAAASTRWHETDIRFDIYWINTKYLQVLSTVAR